MVSRYVLRTLLWFQLERTDCGPTAVLQSWTADTLALHVLRVLDQLIIALRTQRFRSYFFPWCNVMLHSTSGGQHHPEEDYLSDVEILEGFITWLHEESATAAVPPEEDEMKRCLISERLETALILKWGRVLADLAPPLTTRSVGTAAGCGLRDRDSFPCEDLVVRFCDQTDSGARINLYITATAGKAAGACSWPLICI